MNTSAVAINAAVVPQYPPYPNNPVDVAIQELQRANSNLVEAKSSWSKIKYGNDAGVSGRLLEAGSSIISAGEMMNRILRKQSEVSQRLGVEGVMLAHYSGRIAQVGVEKAYSAPTLPLAEMAKVRDNAITDSAIAIEVLKAVGRPVKS